MKKNWEEEEEEEDDDDDLKTAIHVEMSKAEEPEDDNDDDDLKTAIEMSKEAFYCVPPEPSDEENAPIVHVRLPTTGNRICRRFSLSNCSSDIIAWIAQEIKQDPRHVSLVSSMQQRKWTLSNPSYLKEDELLYKSVLNAQVEED